MTNEILAKAWQLTNKISDLERDLESLKSYKPIDNKIGSFLHSNRLTRADIKDSDEFKAFRVAADNLALEMIAWVESKISELQKEFDEL